jgi:hypothetical protein
MARHRKTTQRDPLRRLQGEYEEEEEQNADSILRDGERLRVPLYMRDGSVNPDLLPHQRAKAAQQTQDAVARKFGLSDALQFHRPGFRRNTDAAALERILQAYADAEIEAANAWKGNATTDQRAGDPCTCRGPEYLDDFGSQGTLQLRNGDWVCVPNKKRQDAASFDSKAQAYAEYDREMANAWRSGK